MESDNSVSHICADEAGADVGHPEGAKVGHPSFEETPADEISAESAKVRRRTLATPGNSRAPAPYPVAERMAAGSGSK
jgi:hypothetical protein